MKNMKYNVHNLVGKLFPTTSNSTSNSRSNMINALASTLIRLGHSKALYVVALSICCFGFAGLCVAQEKDKQKGLPPGREVVPQGAKSKLLATSQTGYGVSINNPESNTNPALNPSQKPIIVIASCNSTLAPKDIEAWVGQNNPTTVQNMVASLSGTGRQTITFVVPWGWYYYINVSQQPNIGGIPPGGICRATAWWTD